MSLYDSSVVQTKKMLTNLSRWLEQATEYAQAREFDPNVLLSFRLSPDQFSLVRQVQTVCDTAKLTAARLADKEAPSHADDETTIDQLQTRIRQTVEYLDTLTADDFNGAATRLVSLRFAPGKGARGAEYYRSFAQPNFYFHITMSYALLRHAGVPLGKRGFIGFLEMEDLPA